MGAVPNVLVHIYVFIFGCILIDALYLISLDDTYHYLNLSNNNLTHNVSR